MDCLLVQVEKQWYNLYIPNNVVSIYLDLFVFREKTELLFHQLKREMLNPENTMEQTYDLLHELRVATEKNFVLKRLFWKVGIKVDGSSMYFCHIFQGR